MKLTHKSKPDIVRLSDYFKKIERMAEKMGMEVDDLIIDSADNVEGPSKGRMHALSGNRKNKFIENSGNPTHRPV